MDPPGRRRYHHHRRRRRSYHHRRRRRSYHHRARIHKARHSINDFCSHVGFPVMMMFLCQQFRATERDRSTRRHDQYFHDFVFHFHSPFLILSAPSRKLT